MSLAPKTTGKILHARPDALVGISGHTLPSAVPISKLLSVTNVDYSKDGSQYLFLTNGTVRSADAVRLIAFYDGVWWNRNWAVYYARRRPVDSPMTDLNDNATGTLFNCIYGLPGPGHKRVTLYLNRPTNNKKNDKHLIVQIAMTITLRGH